VNKWLIAALIWIGIDFVIAVLGIPVWVYLAKAPHPASAAYWISILIPNVLLFIVPGGLSGGAFLLIEHSIRRH
jgi:hypothetical protein